MPRIRIAVGFACIIAFASCEIPTVDFSEYVGVNFLENHAFDGAGWIPDQLAPYMLFEAVEADVATAVGTPSNAPANTGSAIYRLEVLNLIPNGDFEDTVAYNVTDLPAGWSNSGALTAGISENMTVDGARELSLALESASDDVTYDLGANPDGAADGLVANGIYGLRFDFRPSDAIDYRFLYDDTVDQTLWEAPVNDLTLPVYRFPFDFTNITSEFSASATQNRFRVTDQAGTLDIDNLRLVRTDIPLSVRIGIPYSESGRPDLVSGSYTFSFFVRTDTTAGGTDPASLNRYRSETITFALNATSTLRSHGEIVEGETMDFDDWEEIAVSTFLQITEPNDAATSIIELSIAPVNTSMSALLDSGAVFITAPSLTFSETL